MKAVFAKLRWACLALVLALPMPASASVTITFWARELGSYFPHAFVTMRGVPDAGGAPVDLNIGFTAKHISPAVLFGKVKGMLEPANSIYMGRSDAHFSMVLSDAQYVAALRAIREFGPKGNQTYELNHRNCVSFVQEVARAIGLAGTDQPRLLKRPRSFLDAVEAANPGKVTLLHQHGTAYIASLPHLPGIDPNKPVLTATAPVEPEEAFAANPTMIGSPTPVITDESMSMHGRKPAADPANHTSAGAPARAAQ